MTTSRSKFVKCPFYRTDEKRLVSCDGITDDSCISVKFSSDGSLDRQMKLFCEDKYGCCEIFRMLWPLYEDQEECR